jgi:diketogulonate reductase-like aldo/keto reductase
MPTRAAPQDQAELAKLIAQLFDMKLAPHDANCCDTDPTRPSSTRGAAILYTILAGQRSELLICQPANDFASSAEPASILYKGISTSASTPPMAPFVISCANVRVPRIIYGTAWKKAATENLVSLAIQNGFRGIDTACQPKHYEEAGVGAGVAASMTKGLTRTDLYLQTKFTSISGQDTTRIPYDPKAPLSDQVAQSIAASLKNLQTDYLDCVLLHSPMPTMAQSLSVWKTLESFVDAGQIRQLGISNCYRLADLENLHQASRIKPAVLQNRFYADTHYDRELRSYCNQSEIIYQSFWTLSANPHLLTHKTMTALARNHNRTAAQILFRYLVSIGVVPLTGTKSEAHMRDDLAIFSFELTGDELSAIDALC